MLRDRPGITKQFIKQKQLVSKGDPISSSLPFVIQRNQASAGHSTQPHEHQAYRTSTSVYVSLNERVSPHTPSHNA